MFSAAARRTALSIGKLPLRPTTTSITSSPSSSFALNSRSLIPSASLRRLLSSLAVLEQRDGKLNHGSLSAITAAKKLGGPIHAFVAGGDIGPVAQEAAKVDGVEKIVAVNNAAYEKVRECVQLQMQSIVFLFSLGGAGAVTPPHSPSCAIFNRS